VANGTSSIKIEGTAQGRSLAVGEPFLIEAGNDLLELVTQRGRTRATGLIRQSAEDVDEVEADVEIRSGRSAKLSETRFHVVSEGGGPEEDARSVRQDAHRGREVAVNEHGQRATQVVERVFGRRRVVDPGRQRLDSDVDDLPDPEQRILLERTISIELKGSSHTLGQLFSRRRVRPHPHHDIARSHVLADPDVDDREVRFVRESSR